MVCYDFPKDQSQLYGRDPHGDKRSGDGLDSLKMKTHQTMGEIDGSGFKFNRYLVFVHKGAGRGFGGAKGSKWIGPDGKLKSTMATSLGKMNSGSHKAEPWLNPVLDAEVPKLADMEAGFQADNAIKAIQIK